MSNNERHRGLMSFKLLHYFVVLAEHGSISAAAKALNISQPTLSENIAKLEKLLDLQLAVRTRRGIQITDAGVRLRDGGEALLRNFDTLIDELRMISDEPRGTVTIGISPPLSNLLAVPLLETVHAEYPEIRLNFMEGMSDDVLDWIADERAEIGCVYYPTDSEAFSYEALLTEEVFLVTALDNWEGEFGEDGVALEPIAAARLAELPLVLTNTSQAARQMQDKFARRINVELDVIASINSLPRIIEMVRRASAYTLTSHGAVMDQLEDGHLGLVRIVDPPFLRTAYLARNRSRPVSLASTIIENCIKVVTREMLDRRGIVSAQASDTVGPSASDPDSPNQRKKFNTPL